jgi:predicted nuclease with TOPRIM domain
VPDNAGAESRRRHAAFRETTAELRAFIDGHPEMVDAETKLKKVCDDYKQQQEERRERVRKLRRFASRLRDLAARKTSEAARLSSRAGPQTEIHKAMKRKQAVQKKVTFEFYQQLRTSLANYHNLKQEEREV